MLVTRLHPLPGVGHPSTAMPAGCCAITAAVLGESVIAITAERDGTVREWDVQSGRETKVLGYECGPINDVTTMAINGEPTIVASGLEGVHFWSAVSGAPQSRRPGAYTDMLTSVHVVRMGDGCDALLLGDRFGAIEYWPNASMLAWRVLMGVGGTPPLWALGGAVDRAGPLGVACIEGRLQSIDLLRGRITQDIPIGGGVSYGMTSFTTGAADYVALIVGTDVVVADPIHATIEFRWSAGPSPLRRISVMPSQGRILLATISQDGTVGIWTPQGELVAGARLPGDGAAIAPAAHHTVVAGYVNGWAVLSLP